MSKLNPPTKQYIIGFGFWILSFLLIFMIIPKISKTLEKERKVQLESASEFTKKTNQLNELVNLSDKIRQGQESLIRVQKALPNVLSSQLQLSLSEGLYKLSKKYNIRLESVKYARGAKEGQKNTELESVESEFIATGTYSELRAFMFSFETLGLAYTVRESRLEESSEGLRLTVNLRAFKKPDILLQESNL